MVLNGKASVPGFASEPASEPTEEAFTKNIGLAARAHGLDANVAGFALTVAKPEESKTSIPELDPLVGGAWSQRLYAAVIVIVVVARAAQIAAGDFVLDAEAVAGDEVALHLATDSALPEGETRARARASIVHNVVPRDHMVRRGIDVYARLMGRTGDRVIPQR